MLTEESSLKRMEITYKSYSKYINQIIHFDNIQAFFRVTASTVLLGCFAGIGFLFSLENRMSFIQHILALYFVCGIGIAALLSFWHLDLIFYERLMVSNFAEAIKLEKNNAWLPKIHLNMLKELNALDKRLNVTYYYSWSISTIILFTGIISIYMFTKFGLGVQSVIFAITLIFIYFFSFFIKRKTKKIKDLLAFLGVRYNEL